MFTGINSTNKMETVKYFCKYIFETIRKQNRKVVEIIILILRESLLQCHDNVIRLINL